MIYYKILFKKEEITQLNYQLEMINRASVDNLTKFIYTS